jgi:BirA family biotin operon repressor/biotin-[acetyl-CoA-carboxylase] ligase
MTGAGAFAVIACDSVGSTNDEAKILAANGAEHGTAVWALEQTAGRGRADRRWHSPRGNLFLSAILRPAVSPARAAELSFVAACAVADAVRGLGVGAVAVKWPNDILVAGAKIAGLLLEASIGADGGLDWVVLGIGINIAAAPKDTPYPAACLAEFVAPAPDPRSLCDRTLEALSLWLDRWRIDGFEPVRAAWLGQAHGLGGLIALSERGQVARGHFVDLDRDGALLLDTEQGVRRIAVGDVLFGAG